MGEVLDGRPAPAPSLHFEGLSPSLPRKDFFTRPNVALPAHSLAPTAPCHLLGWGLPPGSGILGSSDRVCKQIQKRGGLPRPSGKGWDTLGDRAHSEPSSKTLSRRDKIPWKIPEAEAFSPRGLAAGWALGPRGRNEVRRKRKRRGKGM